MPEDGYLKFRLSYMNNRINFINQQINQLMQDRAVYEREVDEIREQINAQRS
jgi:hypothetical protein